MITFYSVEDTFKALESNKEALFIPDCDSALIGTYNLEREDENVTVSCYDYDLLVDCFAQQFGEDCEWGEDPVEQAMEWIDYNVIGSYVGKFTPMVVSKNDDGEYDTNEE
jgi:hypothetical protein